MRRKPRVSFLVPRIGEEEKIEGVLGIQLFGNYEGYYLLVLQHDKNPGGRLENLESRYTSEHSVGSVGKLKGNIVGVIYEQLLNTVRGAPVGGEGGNSQKESLSAVQQVY